MAKPSITKRTTKGAALTYAELDQNFDNLRDATLTLTAGLAGTSVIADLNGTITLVAGTGISLSGDNTAKTVTISGSATGLTEIVQDTTPELGGNLDVGNNYLYSSSGSSITLNENTIFVGTSGNIVTIQGNGASGMLIKQDSNDYPRIVLGGSPDTNALALITDGDITFQTVGANNRVSISGCLFAPARVTTTARDNLPAANGDIVYNTTTNKFQGYANGTWVDLH